MATVLATVLIVTEAPAIELIGSGAVLASFAHGQVSDRLAEKEAEKPSPDVKCFRWSGRYFLMKEALWLSYFILKGAWSALVGCAVFLVYPLWRRWWRQKRQENVRT